MTTKQNLIAGTVTLVLLAPSLVLAETVDTRIGKLELQSGYPSKATAEKLYDEMDFQRATQAFPLGTSCRWLPRPSSGAPQFVRC